MSPRTAIFLPGAAEIRRLAGDDRGLHLAVAPEERRATRQVVRSRRCELLLHFVADCLACRLLVVIRQNLFEVVAHQLRKIFGRVVGAIQTGMFAADLELLEELFNLRKGGRIESRHRRGRARAAIEHDARSLMLLPQLVREVELLVRARLVGVRTARLRAVAQPQDADEHIPLCRLELVEDGLLRPAHDGHDLRPLFQFEHDANVVGQSFVQRLDHRREPCALCQHIARRRDEHAQFSEFRCTHSTRL